jgi:hypothetical protein
METLMEAIIKYIPLLIPLFAVQIILMVVALIHVLRHPRYRFGNKTLWILVVVLVNMIGPIIYFVFGRGEEE